MGFGVLEDYKLQHVPATVVLDEGTALTDLTSALKHGTGRNADIVLVPQPSADPNDPLNWSRWRKEACYFTLIMGSILGPSVLSPMLNTSIVVLAGDLAVSIPSVVLLIGGYILLVTGASGPFYCALSRKWGKRPIFLFSVLMAIIGTAVAEGGKAEYKVLLAARILQGFSLSAFESIIVASIGDMFFVHERGLRVSFLNWMLQTTSQFTTLISGQISNNIGWIWLFHILQMFLVPLFIAIFFLCPEMTYLRDHLYDTDVVQEEHLAELADAEAAAKFKPEGTNREASEIENGTATEVNGAPIPKKKSTIQLLAVYTGSYSNDNFLKLFIAPFVTLLNPTALYTCVTSGVLLAWYVGTAIIQTQLFAAPPYLLNPAQIGYLSAGPLVGGTIGGILVALTSDSTAIWATKRNNGIYEPEFRLLPMPLGAAMFTAGMFGYGWAVEKGLNVYICCFLNGMMLGGAIIASTVVLVYALDSFRDSSNEIFIMNMVIKNFLYYALSTFVSGWTTNAGAGQVMSVFGGTGCFLCILALPVYIYGKRLRSFWARHNLLILWGLNTANTPQVLA